VRVVSAKTFLAEEVPPMPRDSRRDYDRARDAFDDLDTDEQARFLAETTVSVVARGIQSVSRPLAGELGAFFTSPSERSPQREPPTETRDGPGPAEPPTSAQRDG
jgi:hypothetical protein